MCCCLALCAAKHLLNVVIYSYGVRKTHNKDKKQTTTRNKKQTITTKQYQYYLTRGTLEVVIEKYQDNIQEIDI